MLVATVGLSQGSTYNAVPKTLCGNVTRKHTIAIAIGIIHGCLFVFISYTPTFYIPTYGGERTTIVVWCTHRPRWCEEFCTLENIATVLTGLLTWWYPNIIHFDRIFPEKFSFLGIPYLWTPPYWQVCWVYCSKESSVSGLQQIFYGQIPATNSACSAERSLKGMLHAATFRTCV